MNKTIFEQIRNTIAEILPKGGSAILFGSQARGDNNDSSDWDILLIVNKDKLLDSDYEDYTYPLTVLGWKLNVDINPILYTRKEWNESSISPFYHNVLQDGIKIA